jgi:uncharacterized protein YecE (DUF72 family)
MISGLTLPGSFIAGQFADTRRFSFRVKGHRFITHSRRLEPQAKSLKLQRDSTAPLGEKLDAMLWQLPLNLHKDMRKLGAFIAMLNVWPEVRHAIEFRDRSWFDDEVAELMARKRIAVCQSDPPAGRCGRQSRPTWCSCACMGMAQRMLRTTGVIHLSHGPNEYANGSVRDATFTSTSITMREAMHSGTR